MKRAGKMLGGILCAAVLVFYTFSTACIGAEEASAGSVNCTSFVYGKSEMGRDLVCFSISGESYSKTLLFNFAIHGFEDEYDHDSYVLTDIANQLIDYYKAADDMHDCRLLIIPCANPDGQADGTTNNGFGRCNAKGIDLNRDFDVNYTSYSTPRNYTEYPFSASESKALRDLYNEYKPYIVIDFHGWENCTIGDYEIGSAFYDKMGLSQSHGFTSTNARGYFANWAHQNGSYGLLVEFTSSSSVDITKLEAAADRLISGDFDNGTGKYTPDARYEKFSDINSFTITTDRTTTYADIDIPYRTTSYIDGSTDLCVIKRIYENGWVKTEYPVSSGTKTGFVHLSDFISSPVVPYKVSVSENTPVYIREELDKTLGTAYPTDEIYVLGESSDGTKLQIVYPLDNGGYKLGWVQNEVLTTESTPDKGDVNGDGEVNFADATLILQADAGLAELSGAKRTAADVNGDGDVDFADAILVLRIDSGLYIR